MFNQIVPLIAILRHLKLSEAVGVGEVLYQSGFRLLEVPFSQDGEATQCIKELRRTLPADCKIGAGSVTSASRFNDAQSAGAEFIVMPNCDTALLRHAKNHNLPSLPGVTTVSECFTAIEAGASALKLFPAELLTPAVVRAMKVILPTDMKIFPVGGITPEKMHDYIHAGADGFGLGGALYSPGFSAAEVGQRARRFVAAWQENQL